MTVDKRLKEIARRQTQQAIHSGRLSRPDACEGCGDGPVQAHHVDYTQPLEVHWLCPRCHKEAHQWPFRPEVLRAAMARQMLTQEELARDANVSVRSIGRWAKGENVPRLSSVKRLARVLGCDPLDFYTDHREAA